MSSRFSVVEPHPSVPRNAYISGGIGGAGNFRRYKPEEVTKGSDATGPASRVPLQKQPRRYVPSGRGGAGNMFSRNEEGIFQFDEEMIKKRDAQPQAPVYQVGRGGAGNFYSERKSSSGGARKDSTDSTASSESDRLSIRNALSRHNSNGVLSIFSRRSS